jgi:uncharacterized protein YjbI with pentapeptide repeats
MTKSLADLERILTQHQLWLESGQTRGIRADLSGPDLSEAKLVGARLDGADLAGARLVDTELKDEDFSDADLLGVTFEPKSNPELKSLVRAFREFTGSRV